MAIEAVVPPTRSRVWDPQDATDAYNLLVSGQAAKYGTYDDEGKARTQGMALDRLIKAQHGRRFGVSVWKDQNGSYVGALLPREPTARKAKAQAKK